VSPLAQIEAHKDAQKAQEMEAYHKVPRTYLGVPNPVLNDLTKAWRKDMSLSERIEAASSLWKSNTHEGRIAAGKLLTQARIKDDAEVWDLIVSWVPDFDAWAIADHACSAGSRRLMADPVRLNEVEGWTQSEHLWTKRAALVITLPFTKSNFPSEIEKEARSRILGWCAEYVSDPEWFIQKAVAWWVRDLSKHDPLRAQAFLEGHGASMKPFAYNDARRMLDRG